MNLFENKLKEIRKDWGLLREYPDPPEAGDYNPDYPDPSDVPGDEEDEFIPEAPEEVQSGGIEIGGFETRLITMDPEEAQNWAQKYPEHGDGEAANKIYTIIDYGPDYTRHDDASATEELEALAKYWKLDPAEVFSHIEHFGIPDITEKTKEFINANGHLFGEETGDEHYGDTGFSASDLPSPQRPVDPNTQGPFESKLKEIKKDWGLLEEL